jgi:TolB-like protein
MTDEIIGALAAIAPEQLAVIARTTAMRYKSSHKDVALIGRELGVDYVVEGGVRRTGDRLSISLQLIQAADQTHLFAQKYDAQMHDGTARTFAPPGIPRHPSARARPSVA